MKLPWGNRDTGAGRRKHERCRVHLPCKIIYQERVYLGTAINLSMGGVMVQFPPETSTVDLPRNKLARVSVILPNGDLETRCKLIRVTASGAAIQFHDFRRTRMEKLLYEYLETQLGDVW